MKVSKPILSYNLQTFVEDIIEAVQAGWEIDPANPPTTFGLTYECIMLRDEGIVDKPTRAEILADARAAKARRAAEKASEGVAP